jgi:hypothetical protein
MATDKSWAIRRDDYDSEPGFREACRQAMLDIEAIQYRLGGAFIVAPLKLEVEPKVEGVREFEMLAVRYSHTFLPAAKQQGPEEEEGGEPSLADELDRDIEEALEGDVENVAMQEPAEVQ